MRGQVPADELATLHDLSPPVAVLMLSQEPANDVQATMGLHVPAVRTEQRALDLHRSQIRGRRCRKQRDGEREHRGRNRRDPAPSLGPTCRGHRKRAPVKESQLLRSPSSAAVSPFLRGTDTVSKSAQAVWPSETVYAIR